MVSTPFSCKIGGRCRFKKAQVEIRTFARNRSQAVAMPEEAKGKKEGETKDVEMKDATEEEKKDTKKEKEEPPKSPRTAQHHSKHY